MECTYTGNAGDGDLSNPENYEGGRLPAPGDTVTINASVIPAARIRQIMHSDDCVSDYLGPWCVLPQPFMTAANGIIGGTIVPRAAAVQPNNAAADRIFDLVQGSIAGIRINGFMMKPRSKMGGTSTLFVRQQLRAAVRDPKVEQILMLIESPGGTAAGCTELGDEIAAANESKPVVAQIEDLGASAAFWAAVMAGRVFANEAAQVGSIGTVAVVHDLSGMAEKDGIVVHVISTGPLKGAFVPGSEITDEHLAEAQKIVDALGQQFFDVVSAGRGLEGKQLDAVTTGGVFMAAEARDLGLIDGVQSTEDTIRMMTAEIDESLENRRAEATAARWNLHRHQDDA